MDKVEIIGTGGEKSIAGVILADGTIVTLAGEPPARPPTVRMTGNGQR